MRPKFITNEDIVRWDACIDTDTELKDSVGESFAKTPETREVLYTSLWMTEEMNKMKLDQLVIAASQNVLGKQSFGADSWQVAEVILDCFKKVEKTDVVKTD